MSQNDFLDSFMHHYKAVHNSSLLVFLKDLEGRILYCSDSFNHFVNEGSVQGMKAVELFEADSDKISKTDHFVIKNQKNISVEVRLTKNQDQHKWVKLDKMPYYDKKETLSGILVFVSDISEKVFIKLQAERLYKILNAHLKVEETLKNTSVISEFSEALVETLSDKELFSAVMIERILKMDDFLVAGNASWHSEDGLKKTHKTKNKMCAQCHELIINEYNQHYFIKRIDSQCPWFQDFGPSKVFVSRIQYGSKLYGSICVRLEETWQIEERTSTLLNQLANKIAFGFYTLETQEQITKIQNEMERRLKTYKIALDSINDGVWEWNLEANKTFFSDKYYTMLGYSPGEFPPCFESWESRVHPQDIEETKRIINQHFKNKKEPYEVEFRMKTKSGTYKWILARGKAYEWDANGNPKKCVGTHVDISELKQKEKELAEKNEQLESVNEELKANNEEILQMNEELEKLYSEQEVLTEQLNRMLKLMGQIAFFETSETDFLEEALDLILSLVPKSHQGRIRMLKDKAFQLLASTGINDVMIKSLQLKKENISKLQNSKIITQENKEDFYQCNVNSSETHYEFKETIITPIKWNEKVIGSIEIDNLGDSEDFKITDIKKMDSFANLLSVFYRLRKYISEEGKFQTDLILTLVKTLEYYDEYTRGHSERVARWSVELAKAVGVSSENQKKIYYASLMHDIGKIFVQQSVLNKVTPLTEEEYKLIQIHPVKSAELINKVEGMESFARIVRHHHEKYNGKGYPDGLTGKAIPYFSRIISVADAYDAMTSIRPYRRPLTVEEASQELRRCKGSQFDPTLVDPFIEKVIMKE